MPSLLDETMQVAEQAGFNLVGVACTDTFDRSQSVDRRAKAILPQCQTALVLGCGGRHLWERMVAESGEPAAPSPRYHPIDRFTERKVVGIQKLLLDRGHVSVAIYPDDKPSLNFPQLAESADMGTVSPVVGLLLHPEYGPWVSLRAALLIPGRPFGDVPQPTVSNVFQPCLTCHRPCLSACPVHSYDEGGKTDLEACALHRHAGNCEGGCDVRRACPVGAPHRYGPEEERHRHAYSLFTLRKHFGLGPWRFVPKGLRRT